MSSSVIRKHESDPRDAPVEATLAFIRPICFRILTVFSLNTMSCFRFLLFFKSVMAEIMYSKREEIGVPFSLLSIVLFWTIKTISFKEDGSSDRSD